MTTEYTPTTDEIRERWMEFDGGPDPDDAAEFDRWLAEHDREARATYDGTKETP